MKFVCPPSMQPHCAAIFAGEYDFPGLEFDKPPRILDIGACVGAFSVWALRRWPGAQIDAYEPMPDNFRLLEQNLPTAEVCKHNVAVSCMGAHKMALHSGKNNCGEASTYDLGEQDITQTVEAPIDDARGLPDADIVKIDTEGCEVDILKGCLHRFDSFDGLIPRDKLPKAVTFEWHRPADRWTLGAMLAERGYDCLADTIRRPDRGVMKWLLPTTFDIKLTL